MAPMTPAMIRPTTPVPSGNHQLDQLGESRIRGDGAVRQPGLKQVEGRHAGSDGEEGNQQLQEPGHDDSPARLQVAAGAQSPPAR